jgi:SAM-dependent methyltransferase
MLSAIDSPLPDSLNDPLALRVEGWAHGGASHDQLTAVEICIDGIVIGATSIFFARPDVDQALKLHASARTGFSTLISAPILFGRQSATLECRGRFADGTRLVGAKREIRLITHDHRSNHYGVLVQPEETRLLHRSDIYTSGPSVHEINPDCLSLIRRHLGSPPHRVIDVGCGFGGYGRALIADGYDWLGVEVKESDCVELARQGLPHRHVDGRGLPFDAASFDSAICIEVLEHIADPAPFLSEMRRVVRKRALFSVPNLELIPYLQRHAVVPWHLLEGDHKNFFTRPSLRSLLGEHFRHVEVLSYAPIPLQTPEGVPLHNHLFAICAT